MKRPLCYICLAYVVAVFAFLLINPPSSISNIEEGTYQKYYGLVYAKETKQEQCILYLKNVQRVSLDAQNFLQQQFAEQFTQKQKNEIRIICYCNRQDEPNIGSHIIVEGRTRLFRQPRNDGEFDEEAYYRVEKLSFALDHAKIMLQGKKYDRYKEFLYRLRNFLGIQLDKSLEKQDASVMKAILLGMKKELDPEYKDIFQKGGVSHIFAISGLHISILGMGLYKALEKCKLPLRVRIFLAILFMLQYGEMIGMTSSALRAIFMFSLKLYSYDCKRTYDMKTALALTAVSILWEQPLYLFQAGFLLSFGAVISIGWILPILKTVEPHKTDRKNTLLSTKRQKCKEALLASISIMIVQLPILLYYFYSFSWYSIFVNIIILPIIPFLFILGLICMSLQSIWIAFPFLKMDIILHPILEMICHGMLSFCKKICQMILFMPNANCNLGRPKLIQILLYYAMIVGLCIAFETSGKNKYKTSVISNKCIFIALLIAFSCLLPHKQQGLRIDLLDVGQGECIYIETETGKHFLIDGGSTSKTGVGKYTIIPFLKYHGVNKIDQLFITHLDEDHISGIRELIEGKDGIKLTQINLASAVIKDKKYEDFVELCRKKRIHVQYLEAKDRLIEDNLSLEILHPAKEYDPQEANAYSLIIKLEYEDFHALFTGDATTDGEMLALEQLKNWKCNLYKVTHHGSAYSNSSILIDSIRPDFAVISCGKHNNYGHPHQETLERLRKAGVNVYRTDENGEITILVNKGKYKVETYLTF